MRLWHKDLIPVLPRQQLISQWRECCCIAKNIADNGTPNHMLVNKVLEYSFMDFLTYTALVLGIMKNNGYKISQKAQDNFMDNLGKARKYFNKHADHDFAIVCYEKNTNMPIDYIFNNWHTKRYFLQCYYNLQEKFDCYGMSHDEWRKIRDLKVEKYGN